MPNIVKRIWCSRKKALCSSYVTPVVDLHIWLYFPPNNYELNPKYIWSCLVLTLLNFSLAATFIHLIECYGEAYMCLYSPSSSPLCQMTIYSASRLADVTALSPLEQKKENQLEQLHFSVHDTINQSIFDLPWWYQPKKLPFLVIAMKWKRLGLTWPTTRSLLSASALGRIQHQGQWTRSSCPYIADI